MATGWRYRAAGALGTVALAAAAVATANHPAVQTTAATLPILGRLPPTTLSNGALALAVATTAVVLVASFVPLFKPRPRRLLDVVALAEQRLALATLALAAVGYFDYTYRLPRTTLILAAGVLAVALPLWFVAIGRRRPDGDRTRAVIVGDDPATMEATLAATDVPVLGYVSPPGPPERAVDLSDREMGVPDGGRAVVATRLADLECLGGLSRLEEVLIGLNVDTVLLAFSRPDRAEFFGTLDTCHENGVTAKAHRRHADTVLTDGAGERGDELVDVDLEPWDWQDYVLKRAFDVVVALAGLLVWTPVMAAIAVAIKLDDGGPVLYSQARTAARGDTFRVYKFRTMRSEGEDSAPVDDDENDRITRVGRVLRTTHLDELPQLWSILAGTMSVVGPRAAWIEEESHIEAATAEWRKRWFVKPGLTGLAQVNGATSTSPAEKLRYDVAYIRNQSLWFDLQILVRQVWMVVVDASEIVVGVSR